MEIQDVYAAQQEALLSLLADAADRVATQVPACPAWTVRDVLAHVVGLATDAATGALPELDLLEQWRDDWVAGARDAMTGDQVARRSSAGVDDLAAEWRGLMPTLSPMLSGAVPFPEPSLFGLNAVLVTDLTIHDQDVRGALGEPRDLHAPGLSLAVATYGFGVDYRIRQLGLPALRLRYDDSERVLGAGTPGATVAASRFELVRALSGRRSRNQILGYDWSGDAGPYLPLIPAYGERHDPLED
jgi:uncharacterized protein (TIGR03083 family)